MSAWLWANGQADTGEASVADYAVILFGVSNISGAAILFFERVSHRPPCLSSCVDQHHVSVSLPIVS